MFNQLHLYSVCCPVGCDTSWINFRHSGVVCDALAHVDLSSLCQYTKRCRWNRTKSFWSIIKKYISAHIYVLINAGHAYISWTVGKCTFERVLMNYFLIWRWRPKTKSNIDQSYQKTALSNNSKYGKHLLEAHKPINSSITSLFPTEFSDNYKTHFWSMH